MRQSDLFTKTTKNIPKDETSINAQLLIKAGFVYKEMAGVYSFLPLGLKVLNKINDIIREEMNGIGGQEIHMTVLQDKELWKKSRRWSDEVVDNWFKTKLKNDTELGLAFTHEEPLTAIMKSQIASYKDLPKYVYQIQTKFRNEVRAKAGIMRGREFLMKDLYSFSRTKEEHDNFYEEMKKAYMSMFRKLGLGDKTYATISSGGSFSKYSYEFQTISEVGEDVILIDEENKVAVNKGDFNDELIKDFNLDKDVSKYKEEKSIEVGDIYSLGYKYSKALDLKYTTKEGKEEYVYMGSYGVSPTRLMGTIVELSNNENGIIWPKEVSPFNVHLILLNPNDENIRKIGDDLYSALQKNNIEVLYDDRINKSAGEKLADSDLMGVSQRVVISKKTVEKDKFEHKFRNEKEFNLLNREELLNLIKDNK